MTNTVFTLRFRLTAVALAACTLCVAARAESDVEGVPPVQVTVTVGAETVSYTHLDVYKRQSQACADDRCDPGSSR